MITKKKVLSWLHEHPIATLSNDEKLNLPIVYTYVNKDYQCYFVTKEVAHKNRNLIKNKVISVSWYDEQTLTTCELSGGAHAVQTGEGAAVATCHLQEIVRDQESKQKTLPVGKIEKNQYVMFQVVPDEITYTDYSSTTTVHSSPKRLKVLP